MLTLDDYMDVIMSCRIFQDIAERTAGHRAHDFVRHQGRGCKVCGLPKRDFLHHAYFQGPTDWTIVALLTAGTAGGVGR